MSIQQLLTLIMLLEYSRSACTSIVLFIKPFLDYPCPVQQCVTLEQFAADCCISSHTTMEATLKLDPGNHSLPVSITLENTKRFSMSSENTNTTIILCSQSALLRFNNVTMVTIANLTFVGCGQSSRFNAVLNIFRSKVIITACMFLLSKGRVIEAKNSEVAINGSTFRLSRAGVLEANNTVIIDKGSVYDSNIVANFNGPSAILFIRSGYTVFNACIFHLNCQGKTFMMHVKESVLVLKLCEVVRNKGDSSRSLMRSDNSSVEIEQTNFKDNKDIILFLVFAGNLTLNNSTILNNTVKRKIFYAHKSLVEIEGTDFKYNTAETRLLQVFYCNITISNSVLLSNTVKHFGILYISSSSLQTDQTLEIKENIAATSTVDLHNSNATFNGNVLFLHNRGCILIWKSDVVFSEASTFSNNMQFYHKSLYEFGGAITSMWSDIHFWSTTTFSENYSHRIGGAIVAIESHLYLYGNALLQHNTANGEGGALYLDHTELNCQKNTTFHMNYAMKGGGIHAINSHVIMIKETKLHVATTLLSFINNSAEIGGGISLESSSRIQSPFITDHEYVIQFISNIAQKGGAVYVNDYTNAGICTNTSSSLCFLQTPSFNHGKWKGRVEIYSNIGKETLYGGLLDRCIVRGGLGNIHNEVHLVKGISHLERVTENRKIDEMITSDPVRVCYCHNGGKNCAYNHLKVKVRKGETFNVEVIAVDQVENEVNAAIFVHRSLSNYAYLKWGQEIQAVPDKCSNLTLNVFSSNQSVQLILYAAGPCKEQGISKAFLEVQFLPCICQIGFQQTGSDEHCQCDCDFRIKPHITNCNYSTNSLLRQGDFWINYISETGNIGYIIYPNCPYDYCHPASVNVTINLNIPNGADVQCAFNRTGLLCSKCKPGLTLSLGSSQCIPCPSDWPRNFILIVFGAVISGVALVAVILLLNLTVAFGTLNGLIFYANILAANNATYLPLSKSKFFSVFIAWLNLELGINTCFYRGMDTYAKVWLQFLFPAYLIGILFMVIVIGKYSSRFANVIGKRNPIATLATLILISYTKFISNIIDIFSAANVLYPNGSHRLLWMPDANVKYLQGRHIPLFLTGTVVVIIGLIYTVFLFSWQWILHVPNYKLLRWIRNTRLHLFMDANVAAYNSKHRYWIGLLLLVRVALYLEIAYNNSYESSTSVLVTGLIAAWLLLLKVWVGNIYKKKLIDYLNSFCYFNLLMLSVSQLYCQAICSKQCQQNAIEISVGTTFCLLLGAFIFHTISTLLEVPFLRACLTFKPKNNSNNIIVTAFLTTSQRNNLTIQALSSKVTPTSTEVALSQLVNTEESENKEEDGTSMEKRVSPELSSKTSWEFRDSLREPLLQ